MVQYDPFSDAVMSDPWPAYAELRRDAPVYYLEKYDTWFLSRFEDIWESTMKDLFTAERGVTPEMVLLKNPPPPDPMFAMLDKPRQREYRKMLAPPYKRGAVAKSEEGMRTIAQQLLEPLAEQGHFDVYRDLATPVSTRIIAGIIGLPTDVAIRLRALVATYFQRVPGQVATLPENESARLEIMKTLVEFIQRRMQDEDQSGDDHISVLVRSEAEGAPLSMGSMAGAVYTMLVTGVEVVSLAVANTIYYLWQHPDQRNAVVADPDLIPHAYAESLRYDQPTNLLGRFVKSEVEMRGQRLLPGQGVMFLWASGNRDENEFERADEFDIYRRPTRSLSFGHGIHKCIGEHLANLEGRVMLEEILAVAPDYEVGAGAKRSYSEFLQGYYQMPIEFNPR